MKKFLLTIFILMFGLGAFAGEQEDALKFFNSYVQASNSYSTSVLNMYSEDAKITRQIIKPDGSTVNLSVPIDDYKAQMRLNSKIAKLRNYKNFYSNITVTKVPNGYKIDSMRKPSLSDYKLKSSMVVQKQPDGKWLIVEDSTQTKEQILLKYAKHKQGK